MTRRLLSEERGDIGLMQLLMAVLISGLMLGATLAMYGTMLTEDRELNARNDAQERARSALDRLARDLRNLASPTPNAPEAVDRSSATDLIFKTVDANGPNAGTNSTNVQRVRYCLDTSAAGNTKLVSQRQTWTQTDPPAYPTGTGCPAAGWDVDKTTVLVDRVTNYAGGLTRPVFTYNSATPADISSIHADLRLDLDVGRGAKETELSTGVFLRNQNRKPVASFTWFTNTEGAVLNGSASSDPEGQQLRYLWYEGATFLGEGITFLLEAPKGSEHTITLKVKDAGDLVGEYTETGVKA
jgi:type II secretory pathway component PulJ